MEKQKRIKDLKAQLRRIRYGYNGGGVFLPFGAAIVEQEIVAELKKLGAYG